MSQDGEIRILGMAVHVCELCNHRYLGGRSGKGKHKWLCRSCRQKAQAERESQRKAIPKALRTSLMTKYKCCQQCGSTQQLTLDHRVALAHGGDNSESNLSVLCHSCNARKGARS